MSMEPQTKECVYEKTSLDNENVVTNIEVSIQHTSTSENLTTEVPLMELTSTSESESITTESPVTEQPSTLGCLATGSDVPATTHAIISESLHTTDIHRGSWMRTFANRLKRKKNPKMIRDLADIELDEEELKKKYLAGLKLRKRFPYFLTYKIPFLRRFRPVDEEEKENKYSIMAIPDKVYARYFRGVKNPWDYGASPLPFWTPPKV